MKPFNYHTHSTYCDGKNSLSEIAAEAYKLGFDSLGFSCHSYLVNDEGCIPPHLIDSYKAEIRGLQDQYHPKGLEIFLGIEQDACSQKIKNNDYDYVIGSVHNIILGDERVVIDSKKSYHISLQKYFGGDAIALSTEYYKVVEKLYELTECQIVGHIDLVTKFNESNCLFDERDPRYENAASAAIEKLARKGLIFEINTGAIPRGYRSEPYPSKRLLSMIHEANGRITFSSDCHDIRYLGYGFDAVKRLAKESGFDHMMKLKRDGKGCCFLPVEIDL